MTGRTTDGPHVLWLTSAESSGWATPQPVVVERVGAGPRPDSGYAHLRGHAAAGGDPGVTLVALNRFDRPWIEPATGEPCQVGIWPLADGGATWASEPFAPAQPAPDAWCTLCATEPEAREVADRMQRQIQQAGW